MDSLSQRVDYVIDITPDLWCFQGHFANQPILPGVYQVRNLVLQRARSTWPDLQHLVRVSRLKFKRPIRPGERLQVKLELADRRVAFEIFSGDALCSSGWLWFE
jgi:3-hydroxymyristoyl/3-hydroxydecanoyl-(acyl carrier protein) dehydratase